MQPLWDVLWSDARALVQFALPMLALALPISALAALLGAVNYGIPTWSRCFKTALHGLLLGTIAALTVSMSIELLLTAEGYPESRRALQNAANWQLLVAGPLLAFLFAFFTARRYARPAGQQQRRYSLRQLFIYQLIAASLFGWWTFTRRNEITQRRALLAWEVRDRDARSTFEPLGWFVQTWPENDEIFLAAYPRQPPVSDEALRPLTANLSVTTIYLRSGTITDNGLKHFQGANRLRHLDISSKQITDDGIAELSQLPRLRYLEVRSPNLTAKSLAALTQVRTLRLLVLSRAHLTDDDITAFRRARRGVDLRILEDAP